MNAYPFWEALSHVMRGSIMRPSNRWEILSEYHKDVSDYHHFIPYFQKRISISTMKSKFISLWGRNYFEFRFVKRNALIDCTLKITKNMVCLNPMLNIKIWHAYAKIIHTSSNIWTSTSRDKKKLSSESRIWHLLCIELNIGQFGRFSWHKCRHKCKVAHAKLIL